MVLIADTVPVYVVNANDSSNVKCIDTQESLGTHLDYLTVVPPAKLVRIGNLLGLLRLHDEVVNLILHFTGFVLEYQAECNNTAYGWAPLDEAYLRLQVPQSDALVRATFTAALVLECVSHDQGWASEGTHLNHTYHGAWSWIDCAIYDPTGVAAVKQHRVINNFRASSTSRRHVMYTTEAAVTSKIVPGAEIVMHLRAQFPGWENNAYYGRIRVFMLCDIV